MYAFLNLKTRMFISKQPDEKDHEKQRASLERQLPRVAAANPEAIITIIHMDDTSDMSDWQSELIFGPKGGAAIIEQPAEILAGDVTARLKAVTDAINGQAWKLLQEHKSKLAELHRSIAAQAAELQVQLDKSLATFHKKVAADCLAVVRPRGKQRTQYPTVTQAGYDRTGNWLDEGILKKGK
jgi:hypothetical protein